MNYTVSEYTTGSLRTAIITVAGQIHTVTQIEGISSFVEISGPTLVNENSGEQYTLTEYWSDGSSTVVTSSASWSEDSTYASISSDGYLTTSEVTSDQSCTITASYGGMSDTHSVTIKDATVYISGDVLDSSGAGISDVTLMFSNGGGTATTDSSGFYSHDVPFGWSGTVTPSLICYTFSPSYRNLPQPYESIINQDFIAVVSSFVIYGTVEHYLTGEGLSEVIIWFVSGGRVEEERTDASGNFFHTVECGWTGVVRQVYFEDGFRGVLIEPDYYEVVFAMQDQRFRFLWQLR
ncbi:MAG: hypothetical protein SRB2_00350 [Desulfobacteraceae bacterium Eth-SRB2]|nr:MAG: hypothetical protein SRB2_00350 [Desulfobacteraceae bacterium Eth-SRB2]